MYSFYRGLLPADQALDEELWGRYYAITDLWGGGHGTGWINIRFYYNPISGLLEPIAFDGYVFHGSFARSQLAYPFSNEPFFATPGVQKAYIETLERITSPKYVQMLEDKFGEEIGKYYDLLVEEYKDHRYEQIEFEGPPLELPWENLAFRADILNKNINPTQPIRGNYHLVERDGKTYLQLDLVNMMILPMQIEEVTIGNNNLPFEKDWCFVERCLADIIEDGNGQTLLERNDDDFIPTPFLIPGDSFTLEETSEEVITLRARIFGGSKLFEIPIYSNYVPQGIEIGVKPISTLEEALDAHEFLEYVSDTRLAITPGDWTVIGDLIIPEGYNLTIPGNTSLRFEEESVFLTHGSIDILGSEDAPVLLTAQRDHWGGLVVLNAPEPSNWQYVNVEKMSGITDPGWVLTGGVTFYESAVDISFSTIGKNSTEDALNVVRSPFSFAYVEFRDTASDAFDGDFTTGSVTQCGFHDITGDALDVSGSDVTVIKSYFVNIGDKAISAGEKSDVVINDIDIRNVNIGIASKDLSSVFVDSAKIDGAIVAGLAAYIKKPQYGPASLEAVEVEILNTETPTLCQTDSQLILNGEIVHTEDIDVEALYMQDQMGH
ncbi:MAG: hypothetical protein FJ010_05365 [Chloroflexi bacterium]|nr:hypothetical protein [Chloroflexota bacterium]